MDSDLVKTEEWDFAADVDARWTDAEDTLLLQPVLGIDGTSGDGCRQSRRHCNGHNIQSPDHQLPPSQLDRKTDTQNIVKLNLLKGRTK